MQHLFERQLGKFIESPACSITHFLEGCWHGVNLEQFGRTIYRRLPGRCLGGCSRREIKLDKHLSRGKTFRLQLGLQATLDERGQGLLGCSGASIPQLHSAARAVDFGEVDDDWNTD